MQIELLNRKKWLTYVELATLRRTTSSSSNIFLHRDFRSLS